MKALAVIDKNLALGYKNDLLFRLPTDLAHFKKHTLGQTVVMGQKTLESMPGGKALPGRNTLVLNMDAPSGKICDVPKSKDQPADLDQHYVCYSFNNLEDFNDYVNAHMDELGTMVVSGGATIYRLFIDCCDELVLSCVEAEAPEADVYFPEYENKFILEKTEGPFYDGSLEYNIKYYRKK